MALDRRSLLKSLAVGGAGAVAAATARPAAARTVRQAPPGAMGMLYDATLCIGCKTCVVACKQANDRQPDPGPWASQRLYDAPTDLNGDTKNIIKLYRSENEHSYVKQQCMHCVDPACAAACMLHSLQKDATTGVVTYDPAYCVGCRYCQMACPYNVPKFEFSRTTPLIVKCELCRHRAKEPAVKGADGFTRHPKGQGQACCEVCPRGAVISGLRSELLPEARRRIAASPGKYFEDRVYGETEGGGTQVLYLSHVAFDKLGLPELGPNPTSETARAVQEGIYYKLPFVAPVALGGVLAAVIYRNRRAEKVSAGSGEVGR